MSPERRREISSMGGKKVQALGVAHQYTSEEAAAAGRKGGATTGKDIEHMTRIGKLGRDTRWGSK